MAKRVNTKGKCQNKYEYDKKTNKKNKTIDILAIQITTQSQISYSKRGRQMSTMIKTKKTNKDQDKDERRRTKRTWIKSTHLRAFHDITPAFHPGFFRRRFPFFSFLFLRIRSNFRRIFGKSFPDVKCSWGVCVCDDGRASTRQNRARQDKTGQDKTRRDTTRHDTTR